MADETQVLEPQHIDPQHIDPAADAENIDFSMDEPAPEPKKEPVKQDPAQEPAINEPKLDDPASILKEQSKDEPAPDPDEDPEIDGIKEPEFKSDDSKQGWQDLKAAAKERKAQINELQQKLERYEKGEVSQANQATLDELRSQLEATQKRLAQYDVREAPEFQAKFEKPIQDNVAAMKEVAADFEIDVDSVKWDDFRSMSLKQAAEKVRDIADGDDILQGELMRRVTDVVRLSREAKSALENASDFSEQIGKQRQIELKQTFDSVSQEFEGGWAPEKVDESADPEVKQAAETYNQAIASIRTKAEQIAFGATGPKEIAQVAHKAANFDFMMEHGLPKIGRVYNAVIQKQAAEIQALQDKLSGVTRAQPKVDGRASSDGNSPGTSLADMDHESAAAQIAFGA